MQMLNFHKSKCQPFSILFQQLSPKEFIFIFKNEYLQTLAFILSYAPYFYAKKTIKIIKEESSRKLLSESFPNLKNSRKNVSSTFLSEIEKSALHYISVM